jgi:hypothetical protein
MRTARTKLRDDPIITNKLFWRINPLVFEDNKEHTGCDQQCHDRLAPEKARIVLS